MATDIIARGLAVSNSGGGGGSLDVGIEEGVGIKITGTDPKKISNDGVTNVTESASTAADGTIKVVFGNKSGEDATKNVAVKGLKNAAFTEKTTTIADTTDAVDTKLPTEKAVRTELNKKVNSSLVGDANGIATLDATKKLTSTQLPDHNHASDKINAMTGYTKPSTTSAIDASTDTLNSAIGKLEKALDGKQASGTYATGNSAGDALKAVALNNTSAIGSTTQGVYIDANGKPQTMTYTLAQSVTADSKLTDTTYTQGNGIEISDTHVVKNTGVLAVKNSPSVDTEGKTVANGTFQVNTNGKIDYIGIKGLSSAAYKSVDEDTMTSSGTNLPTSKAVADYVETEIGKLPTPMQFKGTVGTGGTVTVLPDASSSNTGYTYKVVTAGTYASQVAKIGDLFISNGTSWVYIPSADDEYTGENLLMTNYSKGTQPASTVVSNTDTANEAVQKIEWALDSKVNTSTTVNDKALSANVTLGGNDVAVTTGEYNIDTAKSTISGSTKINDAIEQLDYRTNTLGSAAYKDVDTTPTSGSDKLVTSGGVKTALDKKANETTVSYIENINNMSDIAGICLDLSTDKIDRLGSSVDKSYGADFNSYKVFGGMRRCNVLNDGTVAAYYGDENFKEDGSNGQVMVQIPKTYYRVDPIILEKQTDGLGYHLRKANYYVSGSPANGFKVHPAFVDKNGNEREFVYVAAYEAGLYMVDKKNIANDAQTDSSKTDYPSMNTSKDLLVSVANAKPISGQVVNLTRANSEKLAKNRGNNWHCETVQIASLIQLLMLVEYAGNLQTLLGAGVSGKSWTGANEANNTGDTSSSGNASTSGTTSTQSISYRGIENPYGNIWKFVVGMNVKGNGSQKGGVPYICDNYTYAEDTINGYSSAGFTATNTAQWITAFGYSEECDWLFVASETSSSGKSVIGDYTYVTSNLNGYRIALLGGYWGDGSKAGGFGWSLILDVSDRDVYIGARLCCFSDKNDDLENNISSLDSRVSNLEKRTSVIYGFHIDSSKSNPSEAVTYLADAVGMTPAYMDYTNDKFNYGSWEGAFFMPRPCMLNADGTVAYYLDPNDYTKKIDGTDSDIDGTGTVSHSMNAMMEWGNEGRQIWVKKIADANDPYSVSVFISPYQVDEDYHAWSFIGTDGKLKDHFYTRIYMGAVIDNKMRSLSGLAPSDSKDASGEITACTANGSGWYTDVFCDVDLINDLLVLMGKSLATQTVFGRGNVDRSWAIENMNSSGTLNDKGLFWGASSGSSSVKVFGMENFWGNQWQRIAGLILDGANGIKIKKCYGTSDGSTTATYNLTSDGYISTGVVPSGANGGYIVKTDYSNGMSVPSVTGGSESTYYGDGFWFDNANRTYALRGGACGDGSPCGVFCLYLSGTASNSGWSIGASLSYKSL